jgi:hypothetical protein
MIMVLLSPSLYRYEQTVLDAVPTRAKTDRPENRPPDPSVEGEEGAAVPVDRGEYHRSATLATLVVGQVSVSSPARGMPSAVGPVGAAMTVSVVVPIPTSPLLASMSITDPTTSLHSTVLVVVSSSSMLTYH